MDKPGPDECYKAPNDDFLRRQRLAKEDPGVLAGFSHVWDLPRLKWKTSQRSQDQGFLCIPLTRRVDMDRVFRACRESRKFHKVYAYGFLGGAPGMVEFRVPRSAFLA